MSKTYSADLIKRLIKQISGKIENSDGELLPEYVIKGTGTIWCYSPTDKNIVSLARGITVYLIRDDFDDINLEDLNEDEKCLIYTQLGGLYMVKCSEIEKIGFD